MRTSLWGVERAVSRAVTVETHGVCISVCSPPKLPKLGVFSSTYTRHSLHFGGRRLCRGRTAAEGKRGEEGIGKPEDRGLHRQGIIKRENSSGSEVRDSKKRRGRRVEAAGAFLQSVGFQFGGPARKRSTGEKRPYPKTRLKWGGKQHSQPLI